jgi:hypothetical protein
MLLRAARMAVKVSIARDPNCSYAQGLGPAYLEALRSDPFIRRLIGLASEPIAEDDVPDEDAHATHRFRRFKSDCVTVAEPVSIAELEALQAGYFAQFLSVDAAAAIGLLLGEPNDDLRSAELLQFAWHSGLEYVSCIILFHHRQRVLILCI